MEKEIGKWIKQKRRQSVEDAVYSILLIGLIALAAKLWFVAEGFSIAW